MFSGAFKLKKSSAVRQMFHSAHNHTLLRATCHAILYTLQTEQHTHTTTNDSNVRGASPSCWCPGVCPSTPPPHHLAVVNILFSVFSRLPLEMHGRLFKLQTFASPNLENIMAGVCNNTTTTVIFREGGCSQ